MTVDAELEGVQGYLNAVGVRLDVGYGVDASGLFGLESGLKVEDSGFGEGIHKEVPFGLAIVLVVRGERAAFPDPTRVS